MSECPDKLEELLDREISDLGYEMVLAEVVDHGGRRLLRVYIDSIDGARTITLDDCAKVSTRLSPLLDVEDVLSGRYTLEVSSPGIERPLVKARDFQRYAGSQVKIHTRSYHLGRRSFIGTLLKEDDAVSDQVAVEVDGEVYNLPLTDIQRANLKIDWSASVPAPSAKEASHD